MTGERPSLIGWAPIPRTTGLPLLRALRIDFTTASDEEALAALTFFARNEGLIFALESAHAGAAVRKIAREYRKDEVIVINMSGRGDKDLFILAPRLDRENWLSFLSNEVATHSRSKKGR